MKTLLIVIILNKLFAKIKKRSIKIQKLTFNAQLIEYFLSHVFNKHYWSLYYKDLGEKKYKAIKQTKNLNRADPFIRVIEDKTYIIFEEYPVGRKKAYICAGELDKLKNEIVNTTIILEPEYHVSFPFIFDFGKEIYMIPESSQNNSIDIYKFINFPYSLQKINTLCASIKCVDSVITVGEEGSYLLTSILSENDTMGVNNLYKFKIVGQHPSEYKIDWKSKQLVSSEYRKSRNAGEILIRSGNKVRVAQDSTIRYGHNIIFFEILKINDRKYVESLHTENRLPFGFIASHTYNESGNVQIIDRKRVILDFRHLIQNITLRLVKKK